MTNFDPVAVNTEDVRTAHLLKSSMYVNNTVRNTEGVCSRRPVICYAGNESNGSRIAAESK